MIDDNPFWKEAETFRKWIAFHRERAQKYCREVTFWQGKHAMVCHENNKLRRKMNVTDYNELLAAYRSRGEFLQESIEDRDRMRLVLEKLRDCNPRDSARLIDFGLNGDSDDASPDPDPRS